MKPVKLRQGVNMRPVCGPIMQAVKPMTTQTMEDIMKTDVRRDKKTCDYCGRRISGRRYLYSDGTCACAACHDNKRTAYWKS